MTSRWIAAILVLACATAAAAQDLNPDERQTANTLKAPAAGAAGPSATLADMSWLAGQWTGTGLGGVSEEMWSAPAGGAMMGMYRLLRDGVVVFYEFLALVEEEGSLVLKLKHFDADLTGWEEKDRFVSFRLVRMTPAEAYFGGLTFRRAGDDRLEIFLALRDADGTVREEAFRMERR